LIDEDMAFVLETRRNIESLEAAMDRTADSAQIELILTFKQRISRLSIVCEDQRHCVTALQTIESDLFDISDLHEYFRDSLANLEYSIRWQAGRKHTFPSFVSTIRSLSRRRQTRDLGFAKK